MQSFAILGNRNRKFAFLFLAGDGSKVLVHTDLVLSGAVAQYGSGAGMIQATAAQIMNKFADNLRGQITKHSAA